MKQIQIDLDDNRAYTQIAFLVDIPTFSKDIEKIRSKYKITPPFDFTRVTALKEHFAMILKVDPKKYLNIKDKERKVSNTIGAIGISNNENDFLHELEKIDAMDKEIKSKDKDVINKVDKLHKSFDNDISELRRKYHYPKMFDSAVRDAVLYNCISSFKTAYATSFERPSFPFQADDILAQRDEYMAIIVTPYSTEKDIKQAFDDCCKNIRESIELTSPVYQVIEVDTISNIKRDRDWYWRGLSGQRPHDIAVAEHKGLSYYTKIKNDMKFAGDLPEKQRIENERYLQYVQDYTETIRKAIKRYSEKLHRHLASS